MSEYLLMTMLCNAGYAPIEASRAIDALRRRHAPDEDAGIADEWRPEPEPYRPSREDLEWLATHPIRGGAPADEPDWDEYARWSAWQDALEVYQRPIGDEDIAAAGLPVG